jgi:ribonuclease Z
MMDCGPGSVRQALCLGIDLRSIDAIVLSHIHEDHCLDLASFGMRGMYAQWKRHPLVLGPRGSHEIATRLMTMHRPNAHMPALETQEVSAADECNVAGFTVASRETPHAADIQSFSHRLRHGGRSIVYSGDTRPNPELMSELAAGADLLLHECFSMPGVERYAGQRSPEARARTLERFPMSHSEVAEVAHIAHDAGVRRLVLTHLLSSEQERELLDIASRFYKRDLLVARRHLSSPERSAHYNQVPLRKSHYVDLRCQLAAE